MKRQIFIIAAIFAATTAATTAQAQDDISKQLEVTKAYTPKVGRAAKLAVEPNMVDTVRLRPESRYEITPTAWATTFGSRKFAPAEISTAAFERHRSLYVRAGAGYPLQTALDVYLTPRMRTGSTFGVFFNHAGSYSKIENGLGIKAPATEIYNGAGVFGSKQWRRYTLEGDATYDNRRYKPYGVADLDPVYSYVDYHITKRFSSGLDHIALGKARGGLSFGDPLAGDGGTFNDLSRFNFRIGVDGGYAHGTEQADIDFRFKVAQMFGGRRSENGVDGDRATPGRHGFEVTLSERGAIDIIESDASAFAVELAPRYVMSLGRFRLRAGLDTRYIRNVAYGQKHVSFTPALELSLNVAGGRFVPFFSYTSQLLDGSHESLSRRNPYVMWTAPTGQTADLRIGFEGNIGNVFTYKLSGGLSQLDNYQIFVAYQAVYVEQNPDTGGNDAWYPPVRFMPTGVDGMRFTAGAELGLHNLGGFSAKLSANWNRFSFNGFYFDGFSPVGDLPKYDAVLELAYSHGDKFRFSAGARLIGDREYNTRYSIEVSSNDSYDSYDIYTADRLAPVVGLSLGAEVKVARDFWVFVEGRNLAGQKLYPYNHYRGLGANVMAGIKAVF